MGLANVLQALGCFAIYALVVCTGVLIYQRMFGVLPPIAISKKARMRAAMKHKGGGHGD